MQGLNHEGQIRHCMILSHSGCLYTAKEGRRTISHLLCCTGALPNPEDGSEREYVRPPKPLSVPVSADKAQRTRVHELCRHPKLPKVTTQTIQEDPERPLIELSFHYKVICTNSTGTNRSAAQLLTQGKPQTALRQVQDRDCFLRPRRISVDCFTSWEPN